MICAPIRNHTTADKLYCEEINVGEDAPLEICSGLRDYYSLDNLMAAKIVGFTSMAWCWRPN
jgi:hypothetical protein